MIQIQNLAKVYSEKFSLKNINITFYPGQITGIVGQNGAGKTTLMRSISGMIRYDAGSVNINGLEVLQNPIEVKRYLGIVETNPFLYPKLTLEDHLQFIRNIYKIDTQSYEKRKVEIYANLNFQHEPFQKIEELSHGNKKKCMLSTALIHDPEILILDEPLNGIDPVSAKKIKDYLIYLAKTKNKLILISSHILESLERMSDRIIIIKDGAIIDDLDAAKMRENRVNLEEYFVEKISDNKSGVEVK